MKEAPLGSALKIHASVSSSFFFICVICISVSDPRWFLSACGSLCVGSLQTVLALWSVVGPLHIQVRPVGGHLFLLSRITVRCWLDFEDDCGQWIPATFLIVPAVTDGARSSSTCTLHAPTPASPL